MIYLDYNATTPLDPAVAELVEHVGRSVPGNASSIQHGVGNEAAVVVDSARETVAATLGVPPNSVVWTSGASEGLHLAIVGLVAAAPSGRRKIVIGATEHKAALRSAEFCRQALGADVAVVQPEADGRILADRVAPLLDDTVAVVVCMHVNNETGVVSPVEDIGEVCRQRGVPFVCDITQSLGKTDTAHVIAASDMVVFSGHKFYGPKGVGVLIADVRLRRRMVPALAGAGSGDLRGGTLNTPGIAGLGLATKLACERLSLARDHYGELSRQFLAELLARVDDVETVGEGAPRVANTLNLRFCGADAEAVMANAPDIAVATGSACNAAIPEPSHVLLAMGMAAAEADECVRVSVGLPTTETDVQRAAHALSEAVSRVRQLTAA